MIYNDGLCACQRGEGRTDIVIEVGMVGPRGPKGDPGDLTEEDKENIKTQLMATIGVEAIPDAEIMLML